MSEFKKIKKNDIFYILNIEFYIFYSNKMKNFNFLNKKEINNKKMQESTNTIDVKKVNYNFTKNLEFFF